MTHRTVCSSYSSRIVEQGYVLIDRQDNANGTYFEHDLSSTQLRHGGDVRGFMDSLDYIQGMGVKGVYLAGSAFINLPWTADGMRHFRAKRTE